MTGGPKARDPPAHTDRTAHDRARAQGNYHAPIEPNLPREEGIDVPRLVVPMTAEDERHMREDLHRDPKEILQRQREDVERMHAHQEKLSAAAPQDTLEDMATGQTTRPAAPRRPAEGVPVNLSKEKMHQVQVRGTTSEPAEGVHGKAKALRGYGGHHS